MSVGPLGFISSAAGAPLSAKASEADRAQRGAAEQQRRIQSVRSAAEAAGISETDGEQHQASERDADGRLPWQQTSLAAEDQQPEVQPEQTPLKPPGETGNFLDLTG